MEETGKPCQKQRTGEGEGHALVLQVAFADGLGMGEEKPREHGQDPIDIGR